MYGPVATLASWTLYNSKIDIKRVRHGYVQVNKTHAVCCNAAASTDRELYFIMLLVLSACTHPRDREQLVQPAMAIRIVAWTYTFDIE